LNRRIRVRFRPALRGIPVSGAARARRVWFGCPASCEDFGVSAVKPGDESRSKATEIAVGGAESRTASGTRRTRRSHLAIDLLVEISGQDRRDTNAIDRVAVRAPRLAYACEHKGRSGRLRSTRPEIRQNRASLLAGPRLGPGRSRSIRKESATRRVGGEAASAGFSAGGFLAAALRIDAAAGGNPGPVGHAARSPDASRRPYLKARTVSRAVSSLLLLPATGGEKSWPDNTADGRLQITPLSTAAVLTRQAVGQQPKRRSSRVVVGAFGVCLDRGFR
jgi:hypothetical protein